MARNFSNMRYFSFTQHKKERDETRTRRVKWKIFNFPSDCNSSQQLAELRGRDRSPSCKIDGKVFIFYLSIRCEKKCLWETTSQSRAAARTKRRDANGKTRKKSQRRKKKVYFSLDENILFSTLPHCLSSPSSSGSARSRVSLVCWNIQTTNYQSFPIFLLTQRSNRQSLVDIAICCESRLVSLSWAVMDAGDEWNQLTNFLSSARILVKM